MTHTHISPIREFSKGYAVVGTIVSALSIISLIQKYFDVGLAPIAAEFFAYYHKIIRVLTAPIVAVLPFSVPDWYRDAYVISFIMLLAETRAVFMTGIVRANPNVPFFLRLNWLSFYVAVVGSIVLFGLLAVAWKPLELWGVIKGDGSQHVRHRTINALMMFAVVCAIAITFFTLNSQM